MKLIVITSRTDGYSWSAEDVRPVEYESAEALLVHLDDAAKNVRAQLDSWAIAYRIAVEKHRKKPGAGVSLPRSPGDEFELAGHLWSLDEFGIYDRHGEWEWYTGDMGPQIMTVDEWFAEHSNTLTRTPV